MRRQLYLSVILLGASLALSAEDASPDRVNVPLTDPSRPAVVNASLMNGGITVTGYAGKEVIVEARPRGHESESKPDRKAEMRMKKAKKAAEKAGDYFDEEEWYQNNL